jgi:hypothetical protein
VSFINKSVSTNILHITVTSAIRLVFIRKFRNGFAPGDQKRSFNFVGDERGHQKRDRDRRRSDGLGNRSSK